MEVAEERQYPWATAQLPEDYDYLAPDGSEIRRLAEVEGGGLCHCTLPKGAVSKATSHKTVDELWYFLAGKGEVWRKRGRRELVVEATPGLSISIPCTTSFQFRNTGDDPLCILFATLPRWPGPQEAVEVEGKWN